MALNKAIPTQYGVDAKYWKNISIAVDFRNKTAVSSCAGFVSQEASLNAQNIDQDTVQARFVWTEEEKQALLPKKPEMLVSLENKEELNEEEQRQKEYLEVEHQRYLTQFHQNNNILVINEELATAFSIMQKYAYLMHKQGQKLKDAEDC